MALMLILQLLTLWPLCHTDVTSNGTQEAQGPRLPMYLVTPAFYPMIRQPKPLGHMFKPPIDSVPPPPNPKFRPLKPRPPIDSFPTPPNPKFRPFKPRPTIDSVPPTSYPKFRPFKPPIFPGPPPPNPTFRPPMDSFPPAPYPKFRPPFVSYSPNSYPKPSLGAQPAAVVTPGINVTLTCRAPLPARRFALFKSGEISTIYNDGYTQLAEFFLEEVTEAQGGSYHCRYQNPGFSRVAWSHPSDALELLVTDQLPTPSLVALPGPVVAPGSNVSLRCAGRMGNMSFVLYRAGEDTPLQYLESQQPWADFQLSGARAPGTYTCYYHTPTVPYVLSLSSEPLVISSDGSGPLDYTKGNLIRLGLGGLVLIFLATLGALEWRSWRRDSAGA